MVLVVNPKSTASLTIANHYARLRHVPPEHLVYLPWDPNAPTTDIDTFRRRILLPLLHTIENLHLARQIDYVIYSSDFPWGITLDSDIRKVMEAMAASQRPAATPQGGKDAAPSDKPTPSKPEWSKYLTAVGSLNGLTYLWQQSAAGAPNYFNLQGNRYMRLPIPEQNDGARPADSGTSSRQCSA
jgi:hypothetical protein